MEADTVNDPRLTRARAGDSVAFDELVEAHRVVAGLVGEAVSDCCGC